MKTYERDKQMTDEYIVTFYGCLSTAYRLVNGFIDHLQVVARNNYSIIADFHTTNHYALSLLSLLSLLASW
jgi:hypothetical protein